MGIVDSRALVDDGLVIAFSLAMTMRAVGARKEA